MTTVEERHTRLVRVNSPSPLTSVTRLAPAQSQLSRPLLFVPISIMSAAPRRPIGDVIQEVRPLAQSCFVALSSRERLETRCPAPDTDDVLRICSSFLLVCLTSFTARLPSRVGPSLRVCATARLLRLCCPFSSPTEVTTPRRRLRLSPAPSSMLSTRSRTGPSLRPPRGPRTRRSGRTWTCSCVPHSALSSRERTDQLSRQAD